MIEERRDPGPTILVVEDDTNMRDVLRDVFEDEGFVTLACPDLASAKEHIQRSGPPDVALVDFSLPDGLGIDLCGELRSRNIPCVIVSAYPTWLADAVRPESNWISKPFNIGNVVAVVRQRLAERAAPPGGRDRP